MPNDNTQPLFEDLLSAASETVTDDMDDMELRIQVEQIRHIYSQTPIFVPAVFFGAVITVIMLWPAVSPVAGIAWCAWIWFVYGAYWVLYQRWREADPSDQSMQAWARPYITLAWIATGSWGITGVLFFHPESLTYQAMLVIALSLGSAAIMATSTAYSPTFYPVILMLTPLSVRMTFEEGMFYMALSAGLLILTLMLILLHRNTHRSYKSNLKLRFINESLAEKLVKERDSAEQANIAKSRFLAAASHDLRQPLHALGLFLGELQECVDDPRMRGRLMERMERSIDSMTTLFNSLLDISRLESGAVKAEPKSFFINELLDDLTREYVLRAKEKGLLLRGIPCRAVVYSDPVLLRRVVRNLIENAIRYTERGDIVIGCRRESGFIQLQVCDSGIGIDQENLARIFNEFEQLNNPERDRNKGIGLGLSVVKQLAVLLDHEISVRSQPGKGSIFSVKIPLGSAPAANSIDTEDKSIKDRLNNACVIVIDDEQAVREGMEGLLRSWGCRVISASDAQSALSETITNRLQPDVIICDYRLRNLTSGIEAINTIRAEINASLPAVLLTGDTGNESMEAAKTAGLAVLHKPVSAARLSTLLRYLIANKELSGIIE